MGGAKAEEDGHRAAVATLVLEKVCTVLGTYLHMTTEHSGIKLHIA